MDLCKKKRTAFGEIDDEDIGEQWISASFDPCTKNVVAHHRGKRDEKALTDLIERTTQRLDSPLGVLYASDEWDPYALALKNVFHEVEIQELRKGPGRPRNPRIVPHRDLKYAVVHKTRERGKVIKVERKVVYGDEDKIVNILNDSPVSKVINTSFIERENLNFRHFNCRLQRKSICFSKAARLLDCQLILFLV